MIYLDATTKKLQLVLAGAVTTNQLDISVDYFDIVPQNTTTVRRGAVEVTNSNSTTDVDIMGAPGQGIIRNVHTIFINNKDTATATVTVKMDNSGIETIIVKQALAAGESLVYEDQSGWDVLSPITAPFVDTTELIKGSLDATKRLRIEVDGITTGTTRVWTVADADIVVAGSASALTANRVVWATTGGLLTTDADLTFDGTTLTATTVDINGGAIDGTTVGATSASTGAFTTLNASGATTLDGAVTLGNAALDNITVTGTITSNLIFTDNTYDIGASGATRPRDFFLSRNATVGGTLGVTGVATLTAQPILSSLTASQAVFTDASKGLVSNAITGSGNVVMSASPTLTGTITAAAANFSGAVSTGALTTTVNSTGLIGTFTQNDTTNGYGVVINSSGSAATRYAFAVRSQDTLTTYFHIRTSTGGVGYVGIGKVDATVPLDVVGAGAFTGAVSMAGLTATTGNFSGNVTLGDAVTDSHTANGQLGVTGSFRVTGVQAPSAGAGVEINYGGVANTGSIFAYDRTGAVYKDLILAGTAVISQSSGVEITRVTSTGLGVFVTPNSAFDVTKSVSGGNLRGTFKNSSADASSDAEVLIEVNGATSGDAKLIWYTGATAWTAGIDNSDSDKWKVSQALALGTNDYLTISTSGLLSVGASAAHTFAGYWRSSENGSASTPAFSFTGTTGTGMYHAGSHALAFASAGVELLNLSSAALLQLSAAQPTFEWNKTTATAQKWQIYNNGNFIIYDATAAVAPLLITFGASPVSTFTGTVKGIVQEGTEQATTSGTTKDFTIASGAKQIIIQLEGVSHDSTSALLIQIGDSGGIETTGYDGGVVSSGGTSQSPSSGWAVTVNFAAASSAHGQIILTRKDSAAFTWTMSGNVILNSSANTVQDFYTSAGYKSLSAELSTVRITSLTPNNFDAGSVNVQVIY